jgi:diadenylate cyclase
LWKRRDKDASITAVSIASRVLSQRKHGALIVFERDTGLQEYIDSGIKLEAKSSAELLQTIFNKTTELHDGAVIIRDKKIAAAGCVMPLTSSYLKDRQLGLRHRAALGISEVSDAVVVIVSEETGYVSLVYEGKIIHPHDIERMPHLLEQYMSGKGVRG